MIVDISYDSLVELCGDINRVSSEMVSLGTTPEKFVKNRHDSFTHMLSLGYRTDLAKELVADNCHFDGVSDFVIVNSEAEYLEMVGMRTFEMLEYCRMTCALVELWGNGVEWGNGMDLNRPVELTVANGSEGSLISIIDQGQGFDYVQKTEQFREGVKYCQNDGCGFKVSNQLQYGFVSYHGNGNHSTLFVPSTEKAFAGVLKSAIIPLVNYEVRR